MGTKQDENAFERLAVINAVRARVAAGVDLAFALAAVHKSKAWWERWTLRDGLADKPRGGRPPKWVLTEEDKKKLARKKISSTTGENTGSMTRSARNLAAEPGALSEGAVAAIMAPRSSKHSLPLCVKRAMGAVTKPVYANYHNPANGYGANDRAGAEGWLRMREDGTRLLPGEREVWDDGTINFGVVIPWDRPSDCITAKKYGVILGRFQLLLGIDCATDCCGFDTPDGREYRYKFVVRTSNGYTAGDVVRTLYDRWGAANRVPREVVVEGGSWQADRTLGFLKAAGVTPVSARGRPRQKLVEGYFNRLWNEMAHTFPPKGNVGRWRGENARETKEFIAVREGKLDPRGLFPDIGEFVDCLNQALYNLDNDVMESRIYNYSWIPAREFRNAPRAFRREMDRRLADMLFPHSLPCEFERVVSERGEIKLTLDPAPHGLAHQYKFQTLTSYIPDGTKVKIRFDPWRIQTAGAIITTPDGLHHDGICTSAVPDVESARGWTDCRADVREVNRGKREAVVATVRELDPRIRKYVDIPARPSADSPVYPAPDYNAQTEGEIIAAIEERQAWKPELQLTEADGFFN